MNRFEQFATVGALSAGALVGGAAVAGAAEAPQVRVEIEGQALAVDAPVMIGGMAVERMVMNPCPAGQVMDGYLDNNSNDVFDEGDTPFCRPASTSPPQPTSPPATEAPRPTSPPETQPPATQPPAATNPANTTPSTPNTTRPPQQTGGSEGSGDADGSNNTTSPNTGVVPQPTLGETLSQDYPEVFSAEPFAWAGAPQYQVEAVDVSGMTDEYLLANPQIWTPQIAQELLKKAEKWSDGAQGSSMFTAAFAYANPKDLLELLDVTQAEDGTYMPANFLDEIVWHPQQHIMVMYVSVADQRAAVLEVEEA